MVVGAEVVAGGVVKGFGTTGKLLLLGAPARKAIIQGVHTALFQVAGKVFPPFTAGLVLVKVLQNHGTDASSRIVDGLGVLGLNDFDLYALRQLADVHGLTWREMFGQVFDLLAEQETIYEDSKFGRRVKAGELPDGSFGPLTGKNVVHARVRALSKSRSFYAYHYVGNSGRNVLGGAPNGPLRWSRVQSALSYIGAGREDFPRAWASTDEVARAREVFELYGPFPGAPELRERWLLEREADTPPTEASVLEDASREPAGDELEAASTSAVVGAVVGGVVAPVAGPIAAFAAGEEAGDTVAGERSNKAVAAAAALLLIGG